MAEAKTLTTFVSGALASVILRWALERLRRRTAAPLPPPSKQPALMRSSVQRGFLATPHGDVYYQARGEGPALLFFHGNPRSCDEFEEVFQLLEGRFRCIALDYLGQDRSGDPKTDEPVPMSTFGDYAVEVLQLLGVKDATVVGHLTGVSPALAIAKKHPARVRHLVLAHPFHWFQDVLEKSKGYRARQAAFGPDSRGAATTSAWWDHNMAPGQLRTDSDLWLNHRKTVDRLRAAPFQWRTIQGNHDYCESGEMLEALGSLGGKRVCVIWVPRLVRLLTFFGMRMREGRELVESTLKSAGAILTVRECKGCDGKDSGSAALFGEEAENIAAWIIALESDN